MRISVIGCGYLGAVHAAAMAKLGHDVVAIDTDEQTIMELQLGNAPFFEPGFPRLLAESIESGRLRFSTDIAVVTGAAVHFICVGTPQHAGQYAADVSHVDTAFKTLVPYLQDGNIVVGKSTVPVGTASRLATQLATTAPGVELLWNPEFLREGSAVADTLSPDRLVYGVSQVGNGLRAAETLDAVYAASLGNGTPRLVVDYATAELVKSAANSFLATKISFINAMADVCEAAGADVVSLADAIGLDARIGRKFLDAGIGFGGGCLPKDIRAFMARAGELGAAQALAFLGEVDAINTRRRSRAVEITRELCNGSLRGKRITVLGAAFKPETDDIRDSPALDIASQIQLQGASVTVTDPKALGRAAERFRDLTYEQDTKKALANANAVLLLTDWRLYRELDPEETAYLVDDRLILDGRNTLDLNTWKQAGWKVRGIGRYS